MKRWFMMMLALLAPLAVTGPSRAGSPPTRTQVLLIECPSRESLRLSLLDHARRAGATAPLSAAEALYFAGSSYERAGRADSAIACYRGALALRGNAPERIALADLLLRRGRDGDRDAARALLDSSYAQAAAENDPAAAAFDARIAWTEVLAGQAARGVERFVPLEAELSGDPLWRYRMARARLEAGDPRRAVLLAEPLAIASRAQDAEILSLLERASASLGGKGRLDERIGRAIVAHDDRERALLAAIGGRRVRFAASDGFPLGATVIAAAGAARARAAVLLRAPGDTLADYDTLAVALRRGGWAVMLLDLRGSGWSVGPSCPYAATWAGREDALHTRTAKDVRDALRALALSATVDTTRYVIVGVERTASIAVEAASLDPRAQALVLLSPDPVPVDQGITRAWIHRLQRPIFFSSAPEDFLRFEVTDALYQAGDRARSRVADARAAGHGGRPFRGDPTAAPRLIGWLDDRWAARARPAPPRSAPRSR